METVIGLDMGTTSVKAIVFDTNGNLLKDAEEMITTIHPVSGWAEQDPDEVLEKTRQVLKSAIAAIRNEGNTLLAVGFSSAMHSLICLDQNKRALSNMLIWSDGRSSEQAVKLNSGAGKEVYSRTGTPIHPMSPFVKLHWMRETAFEPYRKAAYFLSMKEYMLWHWFGKRVIDYAMASATGLYNVSTKNWDEVALHLAGIRKEQLSEIVPPDTVLTCLKPEVAAQLGIRADLPFVVGSADGQLANLGDGAIEPGEVAVSVGTSGAIRQFTEGAPIDGNGETFTYAFTEDMSIIGGPTNNGGIVLQWLKEMLEFDGSHEELLAGAADIAPGAEGILFLPYVNGERAPLWNQAAKGSFYGLTIAHRKQHLVRAVLEGIALNLHQIGLSLERLAGAPKRITANGGLSKSEIWVQILADVFGREVHLSESHHSAARGAAWTALIGIGYVESFAAIKDHTPIRKIIKPNMQHHEKYRGIYIKYTGLGERMSDFYE